MPNRAVRPRRIVVDFVELCPSHALCPDRIVPKVPLTHTELELAALVSLTGNLQATAYGLGRTKGSTKNAMAQIARKLPGKLPALSRVIVWARGGTLAMLGHGSARRIPEHLLRPAFASETVAEPPLRRRRARLVLTCDDDPYAIEL